MTSSCDSASWAIVATWSAAVPAGCAGADDTAAPEQPIGVGAASDDAATDAGFDAYALAWGYDTLRKTRAIRTRVLDTIEAYSVLTRLPTPYRISASDAHELLRKNFAEVPLLSLKSREHWRVLSECAAQGIAGGRVYDALIARTARNGATPTLVTLHPKHFAAFESAELAIASPMDR